MAATLSLAALSESTGQDVRQVQRVDAADRGLVTVADLGPCVELSRLDLHRNALPSSQLQNVGFALNLTWLRISANQLTSLDGLAALSKLAVFNAADNEIRSIAPLAGLRALRVVVLSRNQIRDATPLQGKPHLATVVLGENCIEKVDLSSCAALVKLNVSKNKLRLCPNVHGCHLLKELRINGNKLTGLPEELMTCARLETLELGNNLISKSNQVSVISNFRYLRTISVVGNKVASDPQLTDQLRKWAPSLVAVNIGSPDSFGQMGDKSGSSRSTQHPKKSLQVERNLSSVVGTKTISKKISRAGEVPQKQRTETTRTLDPKRSKSKHKKSTSTKVEGNNIVNQLKKVGEPRTDNSKSLAIPSQINSRKVKQKASEATNRVAKRKVDNVSQPTASTDILRKQSDGQSKSLNKKRRVKARTECIAEARSAMAQPSSKGANSSKSQLTVDSTTNLIKHAPESGVLGVGRGKHADRKRTTAGVPVNDAKYIGAESHSSIYARPVAQW